MKTAATGPGTTPGLSRPTAWLAGLALASALGAFSVPAHAQASAQIAINIGPPAARVEVRPAPRGGMIWIPGFWDWERGRHVWVAGHWVRDRPGYRWVQPEWVSHRGRWILVRGYWARPGAGPRGDHDRDGRPDRFDRDRDGDGVPNRADRRPDNPRRQ